jgi:flavorubredoxin
MKAVEIKKGIYWVGGIDWTLRNFHGYSTERGSTYNAYLIIDEKIVLVDTVKDYLFEEMLERVKSVIDPSKIDYVVSNHVEMDHSGSLPRIMEISKDATVITSPNGEKGLKEHYEAGWKMQVVNTGDSVSIGKRTLSFVLTQMVHWPDSMATYIPEEKLLLPNDAFGQHIATPERFDDEVDWGILKEEAAKYYANIVLPFGSQVQKALEAVSALDIDMIAPSHGIIWREHIQKMIDLYKEWSNNETKEKAVIIFDSMWHSTEKIAKAVYGAFEDKGIPARLMDLKAEHISNVMTQVLDAKYICVGSPTLNNGMLPTVAAFLTYMKGLSPKNRRGFAFGSYGWGGQSIQQIEAVLKEIGFDVAEPIKVKYVPDNKTLEGIRNRVKGGIS